ncbi:MAG: transketolase [Actinomycetota bacterium]
MTSITTTARSTAALDELCINTIRTLSIDAVERAASGHPGAPMGAAPMAYVLWTRFLKHNPADPHWIDRDRFVLSAGHASMLLYSLLHLTGYDLPLAELKAFRQYESKTPGHPEYRHTPGVETTTGPLGQGFATGVGMAMAERYLADRYNSPGYDLIDHFTYAIVSDGDLMEGVSSEAASLAGHLRLGKLVYLYDSNGISIDGSTELAFTEDVGARFEAYHWHVQQVDDGNDLDALERAIAVGRDDPRPSLIVVKTHIGYGAPTKQDSEKAHGEALGPDEVRGAKAFYGWPEDEEFLIPDEALTRMRSALETGAQQQQRWADLKEACRREHPDVVDELERVLANELPNGWDADAPSFSVDDDSMATRKASGAAINAFAPRLPELVGGSADLAGSNNTAIKDAPAFGPGTAGPNINFGVREHAMGAAVNGLAMHGGLRPYGATFLIFSDYMRPAVRLASLSQIPSIFVFTHDSIGLGEDGPTHQPIEHLASLRAMPRLVVLRPADANETIQAWRFALGYRDGPVAFSLTRQGLPILEGTARGRPPVERGAYILEEAADGDPDVIVIATGSEVHVAVEAARRLADRQVSVRVVSMPSWELFERQSLDYRERVLPRHVRARVSVEAGATFGWTRWVGEEGVVIGVDRYGASAPGEVVLRELGFTPEHVVQRALQVLETTTGHGKARERVGR